MAGTSGFHTDLNEAQWAIVAPLLPAAKPGGRPRTTCLLRAGCQWRLLPRCFPPWGTVHLRIERNRFAAGRGWHRGLLPERLGVARPTAQTGASDGTVLHEAGGRAQ
jgi:putative transposase